MRTANVLFVVSMVLVGMSLAVLANSALSALKEGPPAPARAVGVYEREIPGGEVRELVPEMCVDLPCCSKCRCGR